MLNSLGPFPWPVETKTGSSVVVKTKHIDQVTKVVQQTQNPNQLSAEISSGAHHQCSGGLAQSSTMQETSNQHELVIRQGERVIQLQSHTHALGGIPAREHLTIPEEQSVDSPSEGEESSCVSQSHMSVARRGVQPNSSPSATVSLRPPVLSSREIHSRAQSMAKSRLEKAKQHLQGRIQQAISLFGSEEISVLQVKRKQVVFKHSDHTRKCF